MGQVHTIQEIRGEFEFLVNNQYTGEKTVVIVDQDKHNLFLDKSIFQEQPEACPFLRYQTRGPESLLHSPSDTPGDLQGLRVLAPAHPECPGITGRENHVPACIFF